MLSCPRPDLHLTIIRLLLVRLADTPHLQPVIGCSEEQLIRKTFIAYRNGRGLRLSKLGQDLMQACFESYEFEMEPKDSEYLPFILFLDKQARMPYYWQGRKLIVYDTNFAIWLRLAGGSLATLMQTKGE